MPACSFVCEQKGENKPGSMVDAVLLGLVPLLLEGRGLVFWFEELLLDLVTGLEGRQPSIAGMLDLADIDFVTERH